MKKLPLDKIFVPEKLPKVESIGLRAEKGQLLLWMIDGESIVVAEMKLSPEDGWELARDIVSISDKVAKI